MSIREMMHRIGDACLRRPRCATSNATEGRDVVFANALGELIARPTAT
ncbi:MAG: hypothetical protein M3256_09335 [Actinomycetota bacterium]|nr:hypothetical protein [Actinomycetota bacterium]